MKKNNLFIKLILLNSLITFVFISCSNFVNPKSNASNVQVALPVIPERTVSTSINRSKLVYTLVLKNDLNEYTVSGTQGQVVTFENVLVGEYTLTCQAKYPYTTLPIYEDSKKVTVKANSTTKESLSLKLAGYDYDSTSFFGLDVQYLPPVIHKNSLETPNPKIIEFVSLVSNQDIVNVKYTLFDENLNEILSQFTKITYNNTAGIELLFNLSNIQKSENEFYIGGYPDEKTWLKVFTALVNIDFEKLDNGKYYFVWEATETNSNNQNSIPLQNDNQVQTIYVTDKGLESISIDYKGTISSEPQADSLWSWNDAYFTAPFQISETYDDGSKYIFDYIYPSKSLYIYAASKYQLSYADNKYGFDVRQNNGTYFMVADKGKTSAFTYTKQIY